MESEAVGKPSRAPAEQGARWHGTGVYGRVHETQRILVVDDSSTNRIVLGALLRRHGYKVFYAENGQQAIELFFSEQPDLVLMDVIMPIMDGYEATRQIKKLAGERFVPIIFITAITEEELLVKCIDAGGDDFLTKPYNHIILKAKIDGFIRLRELYSTQLKQKKILAYHQKNLEREHRIAEQLLSRIVHTESLDSRNISYSLSPMAVFNGDLLLAAYTPTRALRIMLGDFTGHGLVASIGALPASEIFYEMTAKGFSVSDIVFEINKKMKAVLPTELFLAASVIEINYGLRSVTVWNGGLPDGFLYNPGKGLMRRFPARHVPLGILEAKAFDRMVELVDVNEDDCVFFYTDGVIETRNGQGNLFQKQRLESHFRPNMPGIEVVSEVLGELERFRGTTAQADDITLVAVECRSKRSETAASPIEYVQKRPATWSASFSFDVKTLRQTDPLPVMIDLLMEVQGLYEHRERLYMVLTELFTNALEHGLLELDSSIKATAGGFGEFYREKQRRLSAAEYGSIQCLFSHRPTPHGGELMVDIMDTGRGFRFDAGASRLEQNTSHSGRGIALVRSLCRETVFFPPGNHVRAIYEWNS